MALQVDIIPATGTEYFTTNIEDGIALADASLREELGRSLSGHVGTHHCPTCLHEGSLGIDLHPDVLPFSNIPAYLPPFLLQPDQVMTMTG